MGNLGFSCPRQNEFATRAGCCWVDANSTAEGQNAGRGCPASVRLQGNEIRQSTQQTWLRLRRTLPRGGPPRRPIPSENSVGPALASCPKRRPRSRREGRELTTH